MYLATLENGIKLYSFKYIGCNESHVGVIAQDLLAQPQYAKAVSLAQDGFYVVDYKALGLKMISLAEWRQSRENIFHAGKEGSMRIAMAPAAG